jgi:hypothetical protein
MRFTVRILCQIAPPPASVEQHLPERQERRNRSTSRFQQGAVAVNGEARATVATARE